MDMFAPKTEDELQKTLVESFEETIPLEIVGKGTKRGWGHPVKAETKLSCQNLSGILVYEPEELVISAKAGTPLVDIEAALAEQGQYLAFEPSHFEAVFQTDPLGATIAGILGSNLSGPRRFLSGGARDHLLGFRAVSGRGELFKSGGRVVKNVTGFDLSKLICGSFGTLAVLSEVTLRVLPAPKETASLVVEGLSPQKASEICAQLIDQSFAPSGLTYTKGNLSIRFEGSSRSVQERTEQAQELLVAPTNLHSGDDAKSQWTDFNDLQTLSKTSEEIWRMSLALSSMAPICTELDRLEGCEWIADFGRGLISIGFAHESADQASKLRAMTKQVGGAATLLKGSSDLKQGVYVFEDWAPALTKLMAEIKSGFDPKGILNPGKLGD